MSSLKRDLFERRLWPLAVVIVAAIVAVPFVLHGHRASADVAAPPSSGTSTTSSSVTHKSHASSAPRKTPTSSTRDPFETAGSKTTSTSSTSTTATTSTTTGSSPSSSESSSVSGGSGSSGSSSSSSEATTPVTTTPATATSPVTTTGGGSDRSAAKTTSWDIYSVDLRLGAPGSLVSHRNLARLTPLPRERAPQVMYMGVDGHGHDAVFALGAGVEIRAMSGTRSAGVVCHPSRAECGLAVVPSGKSVALLYVSSTGKNRALVLRVTRIMSRVTHSAAVAEAARGHVSALGLCDLKLGDPIGFFDLSAESVTVPSVGSCRRHKLAVAFPGSIGVGSSVRG